MLPVLLVFLCHGNAEIPHDAAVITLLETARANNLTFNAEKFVFKSQALLKPETTPNTEISVPHCAFLMMRCDFSGLMTSNMYCLFFLLVCFVLLFSCINIVCALY